MFFRYDFKSEITRINPETWKNRANKFRYSQDQRRKETKKKKYSKIQLELELKKEKINGKKYIEWETELSRLNNLANI